MKLSDVQKLVSLLFLTVAMFMMPSITSAHAAPVVTAPGGNGVCCFRGLDVDAAASVDSIISLDVVSMHTNTDETISSVMLPVYAVVSESSTGYIHLGLTDTDFVYDAKEQKVAYDYKYKNYASSLLKPEQIAQMIIFQPEYLTAMSQSSLFRRCDKALALDGHASGSALIGFAG